MADFDILDGTAQWYRSDYIYVRNTFGEAWHSDPIPDTLTDEEWQSFKPVRVGDVDEPYQNPEKGQTNALYVRVDQNFDYQDGQGAQLYVFAARPGTQFIAEDLIPNTVVPADDEWSNVAGNQTVQIPYTGGIGGPQPFQDITAKLPGPSSARWYRFEWPTALIPPVSATAGWHPCLLAYIKTDPAVDTDLVDPAAPATPHNDENFAQRNITVVDDLPNTKTIKKKLVLGNQYSKENRLGIILTTSGPAAKGAKVVLRFEDGAEIHGRLAIPRRQFDMPAVPRRFLSRRMTPGLGNPLIRDLPPAWAVSALDHGLVEFKKPMGGLTLPVLKGELVHAELIVDPGPEGNAMQVRVVQYGGAGRILGGVGYDFNFK